MNSKPIFIDERVEERPAIASSLPFELLQPIFSYLSGRCSSADFASFCLVCSSWHAAAVEVMYIAVQPTSSRAVLLLLRTLELYPNYIRKIQSFVIPDLALQWTPLPEHLYWMLPEGSPPPPQIGSENRKPVFLYARDQNLDLHPAIVARKYKDAWSIYSAILCCLTGVVQLKISLNAIGSSEFIFKHINPSHIGRAEYITSLQFCGRAQLASFDPATRNTAPLQSDLAMFIDQSFKSLQELSFCHVKLGSQPLNVPFLKTSVPPLRELNVVHCDLHTTELLVATWRAVKSIKKIRLVSIDGTPPGHGIHHWHFKSLPKGSFRRITHFEVDTLIFGEIGLRISTESVGTLALLFDNIDMTSGGVADRYIGVTDLGKTTSIRLIRTHVKPIEDELSVHTEIENLLAVINRFLTMARGLHQLSIRWSVHESTLHIWEDFQIRLCLMIGDRRVRLRVHLDGSNRIESSPCFGKHWVKDHKPPPWFKKTRKPLSDRNWL